MKKMMCGFALIASTGSAYAYDPVKAEALRGALPIAALCLEKYGDRETFEIVFDRLSVANHGNPDPTSRTELQGLRDGVQEAAKKADIAKINDDDLKPICLTIRQHPDKW